MRSCGAALNSDNASRINSIAYRGQTTTYAWDTSNRLTGKTLPDGIQQNFQYDNADRVTQIQYLKPDATVIETIAYTYDANGNRISKTNGSASVQETPFTAIYDMANRMTNLTLTGTGETFTLTYDDNGNLVQKQGAASGTTTYTWDSRNRITQITGPSLTATFGYDALGRRVAKTVNGNTIQYVYDGAQAIGEFTNGQLSANLLAGLVIDEMLARYTTLGTRTYLTDSLGSVIAQAKDDQSVQNFYSYTPYGQTQAVGLDEGNPIQYTARETDQTGLYFYRARYYDPVLKRFIREDPIGLEGGMNVYPYVEGNPVKYRDSLGLQGIATIPEGIGVGVLACYLTPGCREALNNAGSAICKWFAGFPKGDDSPKDCKEAARQCREICSDLTLPTNDRTSQSFPFYRCYNQCMEDAGCM